METIGHDHCFMKFRPDLFGMLPGRPTSDFFHDDLMELGSQCLVLNVTYGPILL